MIYLFSVSAKIVVDYYYYDSNGKAPAVGITHPNLEGQEDVIRSAYRRGGDLDPRLTGYFEIHGTGTPIGDPLEVHAVAKAMNDVRQPGEEPLLIGAVSYTRTE